MKQQPVPSLLPCQFLCLLPSLFPFLRNRKNQTNGFVVRFFEEGTNLDGNKYLLFIKDIYRKTYECRNCRKNGKSVMFKSGTPKPVIPHSFASPSVLSQVIIDKYVNHMPLYRQESEWKRLGLQLSRTTIRYQFR